MARSLSEIYNALIAEKETLEVLSGLNPTPDDAQTFLQDLSSTSKVAIWRLYLWVVSVGIWTLETLFDRHKAEIEALKNKLVVCTSLWWQMKCFDFQLGYALEWNGAQFVYSSVDLEAQIIKRAAVVNTPGIVRLKVAKLDDDGLPTPLSGPEVVSFTAYALQIAPAGINVIVISAEADLLKVTFDVYYNPLVMTPTGELITSPGTKPVEDAINGYIQNLPFNGVLNLTALTDAVQKAQGVVDPILTSAEAKFGATPYLAIDANYNSYAGHLKIDPLFPLESSINYITA